MDVCSGDGGAHLHSQCRVCQGGEGDPAQGKLLGGCRPSADNKMEKKIREAQLEQYNYIVVRLTVSACACAVLKAGVACKLLHM